GANGCLPQGTAVHTLVSHPEWGLINSNGPFLSLAPFLEQQAAFDAASFDFHVWDRPNTTVLRVGITTLWCPSDPTVAESMTLNAGDPLNRWLPYPLTFDYTSYCGNHGVWMLEWFPPPEPAVLAQNNGVFHELSAVRPAQVTDGLSQTILFGERAHGLLNP